MGHWKAETRGKTEGEVVWGGKVIYSYILSETIGAEDRRWIVPCPHTFSDTQGSCVYLFTRRRGGS